MGQATSTFQGDIRILGKLDVGTIDPVYTIGGTKYATYGASTIGIREDVLTIVHPSYNPQTKRYEYSLTFSKLVRGSDLWLFYQVTDFGLNWKDLVVQATPSFEGTVHYKKDVSGNRLLIIASAPGEVSLRLSANRYDAEKWPNLRLDQDDDFTHHVVDERE